MKRSQNRSFVIGENSRFSFFDVDAEFFHSFQAVGEDKFLLQNVPPFFQQIFSS